MSVDDSQEHGVLPSIDVRLVDRWTAFLAAIDEPLTMPELERASQRDRASTNEWAGGTYRDVRRAAEVSTEVHGQIARTSSPVTAYGLAPRYDVAGGEVDIGRYLAGEPESMVEYALQPLSRAGRVLRLQVEVSQSWRVAAATIRAIGNAVVALADGLRVRGVGLEIAVTAQVTGETPGHRPSGHDPPALVLGPGARAGGRARAVRRPHRREIWVPPPAAGPRRTSTSC